MGQGNVLHARGDLFLQAFHASPLPQLLVRACDRTFLAVNDAFGRCMGYSHVDLTGRSADELDIYAHPPDSDAMLLELARHGSLVGQELSLRTKQGDQRTVICSAVMIDIDDEKIILMALQDITRQKETERALRASEARFARAFRKSPLPSAIVRLSDDVFLDVNDAFLGLFGYERSEVVGTPATAHAFWTNRDDRAAVYKKYIEGGRLSEHPVLMLTKRGEQLDVLWSMEGIKVAGDKSVMCQLQDVTKRNRDEQALRQSEERFRQLAENIREVFWLSDCDLRRIVYVSPAYEAIWGRPVATLYEDATAWADAIHAEDRARVIAAAKHETEAGTYEETYRIVRPDGSVRWIHDRGFPVYDETGTIIRFAGFAEDISERRLLEDELRQTQKMESLGLLAGGVAHDFNNVLAVIGSCNDLLSADIPTGHPNRELVDDIESAVSRASALTRQLLAFSRRQVTEPKVVELNTIVNETRKMLRRMLGEDIILSVSLDPELAHIHADPGYLVQVLMNLAVNARDAMPRGGTLVLATRNAEITRDELRRHPFAKPGAAVMLEVRDTGCGMDASTIERIFEPFFTTKPQGKGTGMGLAVVHGIIDQAQGFLDVTSTPGTGTTFKVYIPAVDAAAIPAAESVMSLTCGSERILIVDDDDYVRRSAARALRACGYDVVEAGCAGTALERLQRDTPFDLLLADVVMPYIDGRELGEAAHAHSGRLKLLYMSGYTDDAVLRHGIAAGSVDFIEKPFRVESLARKVRQVLDRENKQPPRDRKAAVRPSFSRP